MEHVTYADETNPWHAQLQAWVDPILKLIVTLGKDRPQAKAQVIDRSTRVEFELSVTWVDRWLKEPLEETFSYQFDKPDRGG